MRLNALHPSDNPMEELLFCFGGDDSGGGGGGDSADDADSMDSGYDTDTVGRGTSTDRDSGRGDSDGGSVDRVAVASPNTGQVNTQNFNTSAAQTAGMDRVNVNGQTVAVAPSAVEAVASGRDSGTSPVSRAIQSQIVSPPSSPVGSVSQTARQQSLMTPQQRAEAAYINQAVQTFQDPGYLGGLSPMVAAKGAFDYSTTPRLSSVVTDRELGIDYRDMGSAGSGAFLGDDLDSDGIIDVIDPMPGIPNVATPTAAITPTFAPTLLNQPLTVGGQVAVMPYESYQRSPQQMFGYGGLTAAPYSPDAISFQGGAPAATVSPLGGDQIMQFDVGRAPTPAGTPDDRNFIERAMAGVGSMFDRQEQRAGVFDPTTGTFRQFDGQTTLQKTSDNMLADALGNVLASAVGVTPLVGRLDSKTYTPLAGGEEQLYQSSVGGLLSDYLGESMTPMSEIRAQQEAAMAGQGGDGGQRAPLIVPEQTPEEERAQSAFPAFTPRRFEYQPFTSKFYTIPSRFTRPTSLLG